MAHPSAPQNLNPRSLFRQEALEASLRETGSRDILRLCPIWNWAVVGTVAMLIAAALAFALIGRVEITEKGPGILRPQGGVRHLMVPVAGVVVEMMARTGDAVRAGDPILRLESPQLLGAVLEADRALSAHLGDFSAVERSQAALFGRQTAAARERILQLTEEVASVRRARQRAATRLAANQELYRCGVIGRLGLQEHEDQVESAQRAVAASEQSLRQATQDLGTLETQRRHQIWMQDTETGLARARRQALELSLRQTLVQAPVDGIVDGVVLRPGDQIPAGSLAAKVIPVGTPLMALAFLREKDRAFVKPGDGVRMELAQYPYGEFGALRGRVERIGTDLASPAELQEAFGSPEARREGPCFRVEIRIEPPPEGTLSLRPGMLLDARFTLRRQRLATLVLEPLRRWLQ